MRSTSPAMIRARTGYRSTPSRSARVRSKSKGPLRGERLGSKAGSQPVEGGAGAAPHPELKSFLRNRCRVICRVILLALDRCEGWLSAQSAGPGLRSPASLDTIHSRLDYGRRHSPDLVRKTVGRKTVMRKFDWRGEKPKPTVGTAGRLGRALGTDEVEAAQSYPATNRGERRSMPVTPIQSRARTSLISGACKAHRHATRKREGKAALGGSL